MGLGRSGLMPAIRQPDKFSTKNDSPNASRGFSQGLRHAADTGKKQSRQSASLNR